MNKYYNDYELLYLIERKSIIALNLLYEKYKVLIITKLKKYNFSIMFKEDIVQDCLTEMSISINRYDNRYNTLFYTYIDTIFDRKIVKSLVSYYKSKEVVDYFIEDSSRHFNDVVHEYERNISELHVKENVSLIIDMFNDFEKIIFQEIMIGSKSIKNIKEKYNVNEKKIYNTIQSIRKKFSTHYIKEKNGDL